MLALLGSLLGLAGAVAPEIVKAFQSRADQRHELAVMDKQITAQTATAGYHLEEVRVQADAQAAAETYKFAAPAPESRLNTSVRPVITYGFFGLYSLIKICAAVSLQHLSPDSGLASNIVAAWTQEDVAIFSTIVTFWFGTRTLSKR